jgi:hypothetical protein
MVPVSADLAEEMGVEHVPAPVWCEGYSHAEVARALGSYAASLDAVGEWASLADLLREAARRIGGDL